MTCRRLLRLLLPAALAFGCLVPVAHASVTLLQDGSDPALPAQILVHDEIRKGDFAAFERAADRVRAAARINDVPFVTVLLRSQGGNVVEAMRIGQLLHRRMMLTLVRPREECSSACVFILIAGAVHTPTGARIGVHRPEIAPASRARLSDTQAREFYDGLAEDLRAYFAAMGVHDGAYQVMMGTRGGLHYFSAAELDSLRLRGAHMAWEARYRTRWDEQQQALSVDLVPRVDEGNARAAVVRTPAPLLPARLSQAEDMFTMPGGERTIAGEQRPRIIRFTIGTASPPRPPPGFDRMVQVAGELLAAIGADAARHVFLLVLLFELWRQRPRSEVAAGDPRRWRASWQARA